MTVHESNAHCSPVLSEEWRSAGKARGRCFHHFYRIKDRRGQSVENAKL